ncbi:MAG: N-acetylmuramidase domain-containing protein [Candidatus Caenarcaniphilales bacterium]|nr:N-acetylmuramidase domain-containing protein [Candidatus Caenarcaniphilales bacterium]
MGKLLTPAEKDLLCQDFAHQYRIEPALLRSIVEVESRASGFYPAGHEFAGKCLVRFEADWFQRYAGAKPAFLPSSVSVQEAKTNPKYNGRAAYEKALSQNRDAAIQGTSFGLGQVMGLNFQGVGYASPSTFATAMETSEYDQLAAMVRFVAADSVLMEAARKLDFETIARRYNGPNYAKHNYHIKIRDAYIKYSGGIPA